MKKLDKLHALLLHLLSASKDLEDVLDQGPDADPAQLRIAFHVLDDLLDSALQIATPIRKDFANEAARSGPSRHD